MEVLKVVGQGQVLDPALQGARPERSRPESVTGPPSTPEESGGVAPDEAKIKQVADQLEARTGMQVQMAKDQKSGETVLRVMSPDGKRVLRQYPSEAVLELADRLRSPGAEGLLASLVQ